MLRASSTRCFRVTVLGAAGCVGQPLSMQLKRTPLVTDLRLYDLSAAKGVAEDLAHMPTPGKVTGYGPGHIAAALEGSRVVLICAGVARKPGMSRDDLFNTNALVIRELVTEAATTCPNAVIGIITNPLNSMTAVAARALEDAGCYNPKKLFGIMSLDIARATTFLAEVSEHHAYEVVVPCIGGHSGGTLVPLFSQAGTQLTQDQAEYLTYRLRTAGDTVVKLRQGRGSSALSIGYAGAAWVERVLRALNGEKGIVDYNLIESPLEAPKCRFFGSPHELGAEGVERVLPLPPLSEYEERLLDRCLPDLEKNLRKGFEYHDADQD